MDEKVHSVVPYGKHEYINFAEHIKVLEDIVDSASAEDSADKKNADEH